MCFVQTSGITTGLSCATQVANAFLLAFDRHVQTSLHNDVLLMKRFVDDVLIVCINHTLSQLLDIFNNWCAGVAITNDDGADCTVTTFLDLRIRFQHGCLFYSTFRKPLNAYAYLPFSSNHSTATKLGIISTEAFRLYVTNRCKQSFESEIVFFARKLCDRGFPKHLVFSTLDRFPWHKKDFYLNRRQAFKVPVVPFKLCWTPLFKNFKFGSIVRSHVDALDLNIRDRLKVVLCHTSDPNLFRRHYGRFL